MSRPPEQRNTLSPRWWIHLCQWLWDRRKFVWGTLIVGILISVVSTWLTTSTSIFTGTLLGAALQWVYNHLLLAGFIGVCLLFLTLLVGTVSHLAGVSTRVSEASDLQQSRGALIRLLRGEYYRQITQSLQGATLMALALQQRTDVVRSSAQLVSWRMDELGVTPRSAPASIVQAYDDAGRGLLILGAPGAGKSTLLRELASELLTRAKDDATQPIPVNVNLSSWAIKKPPLTAWMVNQLWETYNIPPRLSQALIQQNQLLFLLDGLDEVEAPARTNCIEAINAYLAEQEQIIPIVVCSRSHVYLEQEERLRLSLAVEIRPLTSEQVDSYLKGAGQPLAAVRTTLRSNAVLRELVTTPLMLSVVMLAYRGKTAKDLPQPGSAEEQQHQVFDYYVTRMLESRARKWRYASGQTRKWLIWLAQQMEQRGFTEFYVERLQPTWLATKRSRTLYYVLSLLSSMGLGFGLFGLLLGDLLRGLNGGLLVALFSFLVGGLFGGLVSKADNPRQGIRPAETLKWSWKNAKPWVVIGPIFGVAIGLIGGLALRWPGGLIGGLIFALALTLALVLVGGLSGEQINESMRVHPNQGIRSSGRIALFTGLVCVLISAPAGMLVGGPAVGLVSGLAFGLLGGLVFGGGAFIQHFILRFLLWRSGAMPWRYVRFLEEATERILLQRVGGGYRFIHPLFQEYFASLATPAPSPFAEKSSSRQS